MNESCSSRSKPKSLSSRNLSKDTAEKWKSGSLATYDRKEWLTFDVDKKGHVVYLKCKVCNIYLSNIEHMENFSRAWTSEGSSNLHLSHAIDHAGGDPHKFATLFPAYRRLLFSFFKCKYWVDKPYYPYITMRQ